MRLAASVLATQSRAASLITPPQTQQARFKHLELILTVGRQVLMVLVLESGQVHQQILALKETFSQERLSATAEQLSVLLRGKDAGGLVQSPTEMGTLAAEIFQLVQAELHSAETGHANEFYQDGLTHVLAEPEFSDTDAAQRALRVFEERPLLEDLIGGEGRWEALNDFSLVLARYGSPDAASGYLGVLGPIRMSYGRAVSTVDYVASLLSEMVAESMSAHD
jgi:heat-inducible transcriptional repressor